MSLRGLGHRFVVWGNHNPFLMAIIFDLLIVAAGLLAFQIQNDHSIANAKREVAVEAKARADALAKSQLDVCTRAVVAVTSQLNADLLKVIQTIKDRITEQGRPVPAVYFQLELLINNRQPPVEACVPKEGP